jgi:hypothetical protein
MCAVVINFVLIYQNHMQMGNKKLPLRRKAATTAAYKLACKAACPALLKTYIHQAQAKKSYESMSEEEKKKQQQDTNITTMDMPEVLACGPVMFQAVTVSHVIIYRCMLCLWAHLFLLFQANLLLPTAQLVKVLKAKPYTLFLLAPNSGQGLYPGDECAHTMKEFKRLLANMVALSTLSYFTAIIWVPFEQVSFLMEVVLAEWGTNCDHYVWHKQGKFGPSNLWVTNVTEIGVVCYYSEGRKRLSTHFTNYTGAMTMKNLLTFPVIANKLKHQVSGVNEVVNLTEMNVGVMVTLLKNHSNAG